MQLYLRTGRTSNKHFMKTYIKKITAGTFIALILLSNTPLLSTVVYAEERDTVSQPITETESTRTMTTVAESATETEPEKTTSSVEEDNITTTTSEGITGSTLASTSPLQTATPTSTTSEVLTSSSIGVGTEGTAISATTTSIITGDALAAANILNVVNTTSVNSQGEIIFAQLNNNQTTALDFRPLSSTSVACTVNTCLSSGATSVGVVNSATIDNHIFLEAITGNNELETNLGNALIKTGDAFTGLNLVTIANSTFIDSNYLVVTVNAFRDVAGDIIFPGLSNFFTSAVSTAPTSSDINNQALVTTTIQANTNTGSNSTDGQVNTTQTGDAKTVTQTINSINSALLGGDSMVIMLRVHGDWLGEIQGLIPGIQVVQGADGTYYLSNSNQSARAAAGLMVSASNTATISNNATLTANTGQNTISGADTSHITTGDALIGANIVNVANAVVIGRNWTLAIINIFGNFTGNLAFGRPDLWIGEEISTPTTITNGSLVSYTYTIINKGDAVANNVIVSDDVDTTHLGITNSSHSYTTGSDGTISWTLGEPLAVGESLKISYQAEVRNTVPGTEITNTVNLTAHETDNNVQDNFDTGTIYASSKVSSGGSSAHTKKDALKNVPRADLLTDLNAITVNRISTSSVTSYGDVATQHIIINNPTGKTFTNVSLVDNLRDTFGKTIQTEVWDIGSLMPHEEITVEYQISFSTEAEVGIYRLDTTLMQNGVAARKNLALGQIRYNGEASLFNLPYPLITTVPLALPAQRRVGMVLGATTTTTIIPESIPTILSTNVASADDGSNYVAQPTTLRQRLFVPLLLIGLLSMFVYYSKRNPLYKKT